MTKMILPGSTIGIIGAGQLGKMLAMSAIEKGYHVAMLDPNPNACGFEVCHWYECASFSDQEKVLDFAKKVDVITYEFENIDGEILKQLPQVTFIPQNIDLLLTSQHRLAEKEMLNSLEIPVVPFEKITSLDDLKKSLEKIGYPAVLKTARMGYDGKGQCVLTQPQDLQKFENEIQQLLLRTCVLEAFCSYECELSIMVARDCNGTIQHFPISQNEHCNGILFTSKVPAVISKQIEEKIANIATKIANKFQLIGVLGIEFFLTASGELFVNEIAPRPHNSGHYSIEACNFSQFDAHILAITGHMLPQLTLLSKAIMVNILGQHIPFLGKMKKIFPNGHYHLYNKEECMKQRKMGHITYLINDSSVEEALQHTSILTEWKELF